MLILKTERSIYTLAEIINCNGYIQKGTCFIFLRLSISYIFLLHSLCGSLPNAHRALSSHFRIFFLIHGNLTHNKQFYCSDKKKCQFKTTMQIETETAFFMQAKISPRQITFILMLIFKVNIEI